MKFRQHAPRFDSGIDIPASEKHLRRKSTLMTFFSRIGKGRVLWDYRMRKEDAQPGGFEVGYRVSALVMMTGELVPTMEHAG